MCLCVRISRSYKRTLSLKLLCSLSYRFGFSRIDGRCNARLLRDHLLM